MHGLILAGGEGTRLRSDGITIPKAFVELGGRPLLFGLVDTLHALGCTTLTAAVRFGSLRHLERIGGTPQGMRLLACETSSSLHTLARGLEMVPPGALLCAMVDSVMRLEDWRRLFALADQALRSGADACVAVTPFVADERPLYVVRRPDGSVARFQEEPSLPPLVTGGVYALSSQLRDLVPRVLGLGVSRMRGFLRWLADHGYHIETAEVERIIDVDRERDLAAAEDWLVHAPSAPEHR